MIPPVLVLTAHGSADPRSAVTVRAVADTIRRLRPNLEVVPAFCEQTAPNLVDVLRAVGDRAVVTPLLLADAFHARTDIPAMIADSGVHARQAQVLGEDDQLLAVLRRRIPDLHLDIVGGGWWEQRLVGHAAALGIADAVTFHGHIDDEAKHHVVQQSWVHLMPSRKEGWGLAVIEAAQHGVPTIGYRSSGGLTDSVVDGVTGVLVDGPDELVDGLRRLLTDRVLRDELGAKARTRSAEFSWVLSAEAMRTVLESVHAGRFVSGVV